MIYYNSNKISDWNLGDDNIIKVYKGVQGAPPTPRLPQGYTEVEYIENTSTAYINLGVKLNQTLGTSYSISTKIYSEYLSSGFGYLIGDEGTSRPYYGMCLRWNAGRLVCDFTPTTDGTYVNVPNSDGTSAITISSEGVTKTNNVDLSLFCGIWSSGPWRNGKGRIYTFSLTMNNELVRDLVPAKRDSDNVVGLYDLVNDIFYTSPNNVDFVAGNVVTPTSSGYTGVVCYYKIVTSGQVDYEKEYLTFRALESGTFKFSGNPISYSTDSGTTWTELASNTNSPTIQSGETIMWKASGLTITASTTSENGGMGVFSSSGRYEVEGNIYSIISGDSFTSADTSTIEISQLKNLFNGSTGLTSAENLVMPTATLNTHSYYGMFKGCTNMVTPPQLPFTTGGDNSCGQMFRNCTSMLIAPAITATTIAGHTFNSAFIGCSSMTTVPMLAAETLYIASYYTMFSGCTSLNSITCLAKSGINSSNSTYNWVKNVASSGTFYKNPDASWPSGTNGIPSNWTVQDYVS